MVRAKFKCDAIKKRDDVEGAEIYMIPVVGGSEENDQFFKYTPWGSFHMGVVSTDTASLFEVGKEYYLDFTPVKE